MGNEQSNIIPPRERRYKVFRISRKEENSSWTRCYLDDYVEYSNGNYKHIDFRSETLLNVLDFANLIFTGNMNGMANYFGEGAYIRIDLNETQEYNSGYNFPTKFVSEVGCEIVDSEGNISIFGLVGGIANEILQARQVHVQAARDGQIYNQIVQRQTSWDMPPR